MRGRFKMSKIPHFQHNAERQVKESNPLTLYSPRFSKPLPTVRILGLTNPATIPDSYFRLGFCNFADFSTVYRMTTLTLAPMRQIMFLGIPHYYPHYLVAPWAPATLDASTAHKGKESRTYRLDSVLLPVLQDFCL